MKAIITNESKYQDDLDWIGKQRFKAHGGFAPHYLDIKNTDSFKNLQALVDKSVHMKVTDKKYPFMDMNGICPGCGDRIDSDCNEEHHLDSDCLQALDWSDSNE
jgi:hypothetical protein